MKTFKHFALEKIVAMLKIYSPYIRIHVYTRYMAFIQKVWGVVFSRLIKIDQIVKNCWTILNGLVQNVLKGSKMVSMMILKDRKLSGIISNTMVFLSVVVKPMDHLKLKQMWWGRTMCGGNTHYLIIIIIINDLFITKW